MNKEEALEFRDTVLVSLEEIKDRLSAIEANTAKKKPRVRKVTEENAETEVLVASILSYWNETFKKNLKNSKGHRNAIIARLKEGFVYHEFVKVINNKYNDPFFKNNPQFFLPCTLFGPKMDNYLNGGVVKDDARVKIDTYEDDLKRGMEDEGL